MLATYHGETVADPELRPIGRTIGNFQRLTVDGNDVGGRLADGTSTNIMADGLFTNRHHRNGGVRGQPVRFVVSTGVVADAVEVTEQEWHRTETTQT